MARPGLMPVASAVALTVAATLSIAGEHARSLPRAADGMPLAQRLLQGAGVGGASGEAAEDRVASQAKGGVTVAPSLAVGSRGLTGHDCGCQTPVKHEH
jgi:hypothetical protein